MERPMAFGEFKNFTFLENYSDPKFEFELKNNLTKQDRSFIFNCFSEIFRVK